MDKKAEALLKRAWEVGPADFKLAIATRCVTRMLILWLNQFKFQLESETSWKTQRGTIENYTNTFSHCAKRKPSGKAQTFKKDQKIKNLYGINIFHQEPTATGSIHDNSRQQRCPFTCPHQTQCYTWRVRICDKGALYIYNTSPYNLVSSQHQGYSQNIDGSSERVKTT